jgi:four helix bundle protein
MQRKNVNRGYRKLTVWNDAIGYYRATCETFCKFPFVLQRVASQQIASVDSIHRNIAEGYCRRSLSEYLHFLNIALASTGESVSGLHAFQAAKQIADVDLEHLDAIAFKLENGLKRLIESLQKKKLTGTWDDSFVIRETNAEYETRDVWIDRQSKARQTKRRKTDARLHPSTLPPFHPSIHLRASRRVQTTVTSTRWMAFLCPNSG